MINRILLLLSLFALLIPGARAGENLLEIPDVETSPGVPTRIPVSLRNQDPVTAIELTFSYDNNGWYPSSDNPIATERLSDNHVMSLFCDGYKCKVLVYSPSNTPIKGSDGIVFHIPIYTGYYAQDQASYPIEITECLLVRPDGEDIATGYAAGSVVIKETPDLRPADITVGVSSTSPGEQAVFSWTVENIGSHATYSGFREVVELTDGNGRSIYLGESRYEETIPAGGSVSRETALTIPSNPGMDGNLYPRISIYPYSDCGESVNGRDNNTMTGSTPMYLANRLSIHLPYQLTEGEEELQGYVERSGFCDSDLTVQLSSNPSDSRLSMPESATIPAHYSRGYFNMSLNKDAEYQEDVNISVTASAPGCPDVSAVFIANDGIEPALTLTESSDRLTEGDKMRFTLSRNIRQSSDIEIKLECEKQHLFKLPASLTFPTGESEMTFEVEAVDNTAISLDRSIMFICSAEGYASGTTYITLVDNDMPEISMELTPGIVSESAGQSAILATVKRLSGSTDMLRIRISSDRSQDLFHEDEIVLEKGVESVTFPIGVIDNDQKDGDLEVKLTAAIYSSDCGCWASETNRGYVESTFTITDNDGAALSLSAPASLAEGKSTNVTLTQNTSSDSPVTVDLYTDSEGVISFPASVTFPAGSRMITFEISAPANDREDDSAVIALYARANGYSQSSCRIMVTDATLPDAIISATSLSAADCAPGEEVNVTVTVSNEGTAILPAKIPVRIYINGRDAATGYTLGSISPGASESIIKSVTLPAATGGLKIYAEVNPDGNIKELMTANNRGEILNVSVSADVRGSVATDKKRYQPAETIKFSGKIDRGIRAGENAEVWFVNNGLKIPVQAAVASDGSFAGEFKPYSQLSGAFSVAVGYPGAGAGEELYAFDVVGLQSSADFTTVTVNEGESISLTLNMTNNCSFPLTGLKVEADSPRPQDGISFECPDRVEPGESFDITVTSSQLAATGENEWVELPLTVTSSEDLAKNHKLLYYARMLHGKLQASECNISTTMTKGNPRLYTVTITNSGEGASGPVVIDMPSSAWLSLASPSNLPSLEPGESTEITLRLTPTDDLQLNNPVSATIAVNAENADGCPVNLKVEPVSDATGVLEIEVCDEFTYNSAGAPRVSGATVSIMHPVSRKVLQSITTGSDGIATAELPEGYYYVSVTEPAHSGFSEMLLLDPARTNHRVVNIGIQGVSVDIRYEQTEIEDVYDIVTNVKYETNVPLPVVETILPERLDFDALHPGESLLFNAVLTNKGLITAQHTALLLDDSDPEFKIVTLEENDFDLLPGMSKVMPVMVTRIAVESPAGMPRKAAQRSTGKSCTTETITWYESYCGPDRKIHTIPHSIPVRLCTGAPAGGGGGGGSAWGGLGLGGGWSNPPYPGSPGGSKPSTAEKINEKMQDIADKFESWVCDPCTNNMMNAAAKCRGFDPDHPYQSIIKKIPLIGDFAGCGFDLYNTYQNRKKEKNGFWKDYGGDIMGCAFMLCEKLGAVLVGVGSASTATGVGATAGVPVAAIGKGMEVTCKWLGKGKDLLDCGAGLKDACKKDDKKKAPSMSKAGQEDAPSVPSYMQQYLDKLDIYNEGSYAIYAAMEEILGYEQFMDATSREMYDLFMEMSLAGDDDLLDADEFLQYAPECVDEETFRAFIKRQNNSSLKLKGEPFEGESIDFDKLDALMETINSVHEYALSLGYEGVAEMMNDSYIQMENGYNDKSGSVCSSVTLALEQRMTMTRQAIRGTLTVVNGHETATLTDFKTYLSIYDPDGNLVGSDRMQIAVEDLKGFSGGKNLTDGWNLASNSEGEAKILFIPTKKAAPDGEAIYTFSGHVAYIDPFSGLEMTRELTPTSLTIYPSPELHLSYFMQRDIIGDDPLTPNITEGSVPAEFALVVANRGKGDAANVSLATQQPRIVDNEKGLALDMRIVSSRLNGVDSPLTPDGSVLNNFGKIPAGSTALAQWMLESNLLGHFTDYDVKATHVSSYDNPELSLLDGAEIHELIMGMTMPKVDDDAKEVRAFVVNDLTDAFDTPDRIFFSDDRPDQAVFVPSNAEVSLSGLSATLSISPAISGWQYFSIEDPTYGMMELASVVRESDGLEIPADNFRQTDRTLRDGHEPVYEYMLHGCLLASGNERYRLSFVEKETATLAVEAWEGIPQEGTAAHEAVEKVAVSFNTAIRPEDFTADALKLLLQGAKTDVSGAVIAAGKDAATFEISLDGLTAANGYYQLYVDLGKLHGLDGKSGAGWARCGWVMLADGKVSVKAVAVPENAGTFSGLTERVEPGTPLSITAVPDTGYTFQTWMSGEEILGNDAVLDLKPDHDMDLKAIFNPVNHSVSVSLSDNLAGDITGAATGLYPHMTEITLDVAPSSAMEFTGWMIVKDGVSSLLSSEKCHTLNVTEDMEIVAEFKRIAATTASTHMHQLCEGWNWISFPIAHQDMENPSKLLKSVVKGLSAIRGSRGALTVENGSLAGTLSAFTHADGYRAFMKEAAGLRIEGSTLEESSLTQTLEAGYNFIGSPLRHPTSVNEALASMAAEEGDAIVGDDAVALFNGTEWVGSLSRLRPGAAYLVKSAGKVSFNWPSQRDFTAVTEPVQKRTAADNAVSPSSYPDAMAVVISLESEMPLRTGEYLVGAFDDISGQCLGISEEHDGLHFLVVHGDVSKTSTFSYKAINLGSESDLEIVNADPVAFSESVLGSVAAPVYLSLDNTDAVNTLTESVCIYPNPVKEILNIEGCDDLEAEVTVIDMDGRIRMRHHGLETLSTLDLSDLAAGIYRLILRSGGSYLVKPVIKE